MDGFYGRAGMQAAIEEKPDQAGLDKVNNILEEENAILMREHKNLDEENSRLKERIAKLEAEINQIKFSAMSGHLLNKDGAHNLQAIKGIGPAFAKRLNESGVHTFEELGQLTAQYMDRILGPLYKAFFAKKNNILPQA